MPRPAMVLCTSRPLQLAEDLDLVIANLGPQWEGQFTWCARGSAATIDYALVSLRLHAILQRCGVDEEGMYSLGSDHNRLRLDFGHFRQKDKIISTRKKAKRYLPNCSIESVVDDFEACAEMHEATTYDEYMSALHRVVEQHMVPDRRSARALKSPWWESDVEEAWKRRRAANREHRRMVQSPDAEACAATWQKYLEMKHAVQVLVQAKIAEYNKRIFQSLREDGKNAALKFWQYVKTLDRRQQSSPQLRDADTNQPVTQVRQHLTRYITGLFGSTGIEGDRDVSTAAPLHPALGERQEEKEPRWAARKKLADQLSSILAGSEIPKDWRQVLPPEAPSGQTQRRRSAGKDVGTTPEYT
ncbi:hypothetical protein HPB50_001021 [Hyalomma asiaticum]|uniref:Uncharacterized protein n=1 Tax=Hyalomma asiaticum TaxID=266040 RepID=A0ACB7RTE2_HYAAI|nr:hypothetical protein HPB50_001021 [Hyalomma asiaticum]